MGKIEKHFNFPVISTEMLQLISAGWFLLEALEPANQKVLSESVNLFLTMDYMEVPESLDDLCNERAKGAVRQAHPYMKYGRNYVLKKPDDK